MLEFVCKESRIDARRCGTREVVASITEDFKRFWGTHLKTAYATPCELRQIADKLEELNGK